MELKGRIAVEDLIAAQWVHVRPRRSWAVVGIFLLGLAVFLIWQSYFGSWQSRGDSAGWILLGILVYLALTAFVFFPWKIRREFRQRKDLQREFGMIVTDHGTETHAERGYVVRPWSDYLKWKEGKAVFLLYLSDNFFVIVPKRLFCKVEDIHCFREFVKQAVGAE